MTVYGVPMWMLVEIMTVVSLLLWGWTWRIGRVPAQVGPAPQFLMAVVFALLSTGTLIILLIFWAAMALLSTT